MSYNIRQLEHGILVESTNNQIWTAEDCKNLRKDGIIYNNGVAAIKITPRKNSNPLLTISIEDDGLISFHNNDLSIDAHWAKDMIKTLQDAIDYIEQGENKS